MRSTSRLLQRGEMREKHKTFSRACVWIHHWQSRPHNLAPTATPPAEIQESLITLLPLQYVSHVSSSIVRPLRLHVSSTAPALSCPPSPFSATIVEGRVSAALRRSTIFGQNRYPNGWSLLREPLIFIVRTSSFSVSLLRPSPLDHDHRRFRSRIGLFPPVQGNSEADGERTDGRTDRGVHVLAEDAQAAPGTSSAFFLALPLLRYK